MKKTILIKQILEADSVKQDSATGVMEQSWKDTMLNQMDENKMKPIDEFRYSQRCYCGL
ncbi:hypothetical protein [Pelosinus sp. sgz500959]|uniref:hypothetical protein n=1 Tax=Pelosinus sp. sgz500959 TaxID=3242472 RepID=UPI00366C9456